MINLLPPDDKRQIKAGRANVLLIRYCIASGLLAVLLFALVGIVYYMMENSKKVAEATIEESKSRSAKYDQVQLKAQEFSNNLKIASSILGKEVRYSEIAVKIAQSLPEGIALQSLELNAETFGQPTTLNATGRSYDDAIRLKTAFEQQSDYFENVHLVSVSQGGGSSGPDSAPQEANGISIQISVVIKPEIAKS
ncbi:hypothetical protein B7Y94_04105 [Candidatus Saccharibacteria bacterium 32-49-12]|nr:MAG: hypothetical protein B7Y94_04105 [Candidatus Saccharibacteria bacterium 32-49-12]